MRILKNTNLVYFALSIMLASFNGIAEEHDLSQLPHILNPKNITYLDQNWSEKDRQYFYFTDQGSRLLPYNIFMNLVHADGKKLFRNPENMLRYGFIPVAKSKENPDGLPIGFSRGVNSVGISCAACHTQQIKYRDEYIRIDGGQSMVDLPMFLRELDEAMKKTIEDPETFNRFASRIPGTSLHTAIKVAMKKRLQENYIIRSESNLSNHSEVAYGFSRLDAFGAILNKGLLYTGVKDNFNSANAPTSYPYMWDTPQHDYVEWNGSQSNGNIGALARNIGEVIGVFGEVDPTPKKWLFFF